MLRRHKIASEGGKTMIDIKEVNNSEVTSLDIQERAEAIIKPNIINVLNKISDNIRKLTIIGFVLSVAGLILSIIAITLSVVIYLVR